MQALLKVLSQMVTSAVDWEWASQQGVSRQLKSSQQPVQIGELLLNDWIEAPQSSLGKCCRCREI
jgi:hypothetical protein